LEAGRRETGDRRQETGDWRQRLTRAPCGGG
jgi:hypothetical protein